MSNRNCLLLSVLALVVLVAPLSADSLDGIAHWQAVPQQGDVPPTWEAGASFARAPRNAEVVYRFGGQVGVFPNDPVLDDFHALDLATFTWTNLASAETPAARADVLMVPGPCGQCVSIVGGRGRFRTGSDHMFPEMQTYHLQSG